MKNEHALPHHNVDIARLGDKPREIVIAANESARSEIAKYIGVESINMLQADILLTRWRRNGVRVSGKLRATIVQPCVITLEPVHQEIETELDMKFLPEEQGKVRDSLHRGEELIIDPDEEDLPDKFSGSTLDLWPALVERLVLAIDFFPRKPGAILDSGSQSIDDDASEEESPFAVLGKLKIDKKDGNL
jgi:uncharacterized metal-binding protein YceD (DUF177 family)